MLNIFSKKNKKRQEFLVGPRSSNKIVMSTVDEDYIKRKNSLNKNKINRKLLDNRNILSLFKKMYLSFAPLFINHPV